MSDLIEGIEGYEDTGGALLNRQWFVVYTKPRQEAVAEVHLARQGFEAYLPRISLLRRHRGQIRAFIAAYFPRYLFVHFDARRENWAPIRSTRGVSALVKIQGTPKPVPADFIETLRANEDDQRIQQLAPASWKPGEEVEIEQGPFAGYRCIFQAHRSADRVAVLLNLIGRSSLVTLDRQNLRLPQAV